MWQELAKRAASCSLIDRDYGKKTYVSDHKLVLNKRETVFFNSAYLAMSALNGVDGVDVVLHCGVRDVAFALALTQDSELLLFMQRLSKLSV